MASLPDKTDAKAKILTASRLENSTGGDHQDALAARG